MVTLKATHEVKPAGDTPTGLMYISEFDQCIALSHAPTVYFYRSADKLTLNAAETLKDALSKALVQFYPLAGRLQWTGRGRLELNCNSAGAIFLEAEHEAMIGDFKDFCPTPETRTLIPSVDYTNPIQDLPLLLVQLTRFGCGGISIGVAVSHVLVDGRCASHFVSEWARIARGEEPENLPCLDRTILKLEEPDHLPVNIKFDHPELDPPPLLIGHFDNSEERMKETTAAMLKLSKEQILKLKSKANETLRSIDDKSFTRYEAVTAHIWRCASRARQHEIKQLTSMQFAVDFSRRVEPPIPKRYFGNAILLITATAASGELQENPLAFAATKIREAVDKVTDEYVRSHLAFLKREPDLSKFRYFHVVGSTQGAFFGNPNMGITSWTAIPLDGVDFGWGKEIHMGPGALGHDGKSFILPGREEDGSFIVALRLQVAHMDAFKKYFYEDICTPI